MTTRKIQGHLEAIHGVEAFLPRIVAQGEGGSASSKRVPEADQPVAAGGGATADASRGAMTDTETREVELTLSDDGQGFDPTLRGEGLQRIERIARQLGARFAVLSSGKGTVLQFTFAPEAPNRA